jgi:superfamily II DNA helicase RecQ
MKKLARILVFIMISGCQSNNVQQEIKTKEAQKAENNTKPPLSRIYKDAKGNCVEDLTFNEIASRCFDENFEKHRFFDCTAYAQRITGVETATSTNSSKTKTELGHSSVTVEETSYKGDNTTKYPYRLVDVVNCP